MRNVTAVLLLLLLSGCSNYEIRRTYYSNLVINKEISCWAGQREGICKEYWPQGTIKIVAEWDNDKLNGWYREYFQSGRLFKEIHYHDDLMDGSFKEYRENGQLKRECTYKDGLKTGIENVYYTNGKLSSTNEWLNGYRIKPFTSYYDNGVIRSVEIDDPVKKSTMCRVYDPEGKLIDEHSITGNPPVCTLSAWMKDVSLKQESDSTEVVIDWSKNSFVISREIEYFNIYRDIKPITSIDGLKPLFRFIPFIANKWSDRTAKQKGQRYYYAVTAVDALWLEQPVSADPLDSISIEIK